LNPKAEEPSRGGFAWADNAPVTQCRVKLADKIEVFTGPNSQGFNVQKFALGRDAQVRETEVDREGKFRFLNLPDGNYYLFFRSPGIFEGNVWIYRYTRPPYYYLEGHMEKPVEYKVRNGASTNIPVIELVRRIEPDVPSSVSNRTGVVEFRLPIPDSSKFCRLTIEHKNYRGSLKHPLYGSHETKLNTFQIPYDKPLYPGEHQFKVEILTPTLRVFARSHWIDFSVPGETHYLRLQGDKSDPSGRTVAWFGSDAIKSVRVSTQDGSYNQQVDTKLIRLPATSSSQRWDFCALDGKGKELIPGWTQYFWQSKTKPENDQQ
jgi:hypothetical protein